MANENQEGSEQLTDEQIHENLRAHAEALDEGEEPAQPIVSKTPASTNKPGEAGSEADGGRAPEADAGKEKPSSETPTEGQEGKEKPAEGQQAAEGVKPVEKQPSKWAKAKKDNARYDRNWQKLEARSREVQAREQRLAEAERMRQRQPDDMANRPRFKSNDYWDAAEGFEKEGLRLMKEDPEAAQEKFTFAADARRQAQRAYEVEYQEAQTQAFKGFEQAWSATAESVIKEEPALADPESQMAQDMIELLEAYPLLGQHPEGFKYAHELLKLRAAAGEVSELREQREKDKKEIERLNADKALSGGPDASKHSQRANNDFNSLSEDEQREWLRRDAERADAA